MCKYESLIDGTLCLMDIALMNDKLLVNRDNDSLMHKKMAELRNNG